MNQNNLMQLRQKRYNDFCRFMKSKGYTTPAAIKRFQVSMAVSALTYMLAMTISYFLALMVIPNHETLVKVTLIAFAFWVLASKLVSYRWAKAFQENNYVE